MWLVRGRVSAIAGSLDLTPNEAGVTEGFEQRREVA